MKLKIKQNTTLIKDVRVSEKVKQYAKEEGHMQTYIERIQQLNNRGWM